MAVIIYVYWQYDIMLPLWIHVSGILHLVIAPQISHETTRRSLSQNYLGNWGRGYLKCPWGHRVKNKWVVMPIERKEEVIGPWETEEYIYTHFSQMIFTLCHRLLSSNSSSQNFWSLDPITLKNYWGFQKAFVYVGSINIVVPGYSQGIVSRTPIDTKIQVCSNPLYKKT